MGAKKTGFFLAWATLVLTSLACRTLLGGARAISPNIQPPKPSPTSTETPAPFTARLSGADLPDLDFGPVGDSPHDPYRPQLRDDPQTLDTKNFRIHYTLSGRDRVPPDDKNENNHPDYVEEVARAMEFSWYAEVEYFGWTAPPPDGDLGGDSRYDVYLEDILDDDIAGYTDWDYEEDEGIDNPNSERIESFASTSFIALDNDYAEYSESSIPWVETLEYMQVTAAHELHHAIQFGYDAFEPHGWLWEASATWMQDEVFDSINEGIDILPSALKATDSCQLDEGGDERVEDADHWYGLWIFIRYLSETYGHESVRELWELAIDSDRYANWDRLLEQRETNLEDFFEDYSVALLTRGFHEGGDYPLIRLEGEVELDRVFEPVDGVGQIGADYLEIQGDGLLTVELSNQSLRGLVVGIRDAQAFLFSVGDRTSFDADLFERSYLIVMNLERASGEANCHFADYTVTLNEASVAVKPSQVLSAPNFQAPRIEGLLDPEDFE